MSPQYPPSHTGWHMDQRLALHNVQAPRSARVLARLLVVLLVVTGLALTVTPWQQNIPGSGRVIAFSPEERLQQIEAAVDGRVVKWHVVEGSRVRRGSSASRASGCRRSAADCRRTARAPGRR